MTPHDGTKRKADLVGTASENDIAVVRMSGVRPAPAKFADLSEVCPGTITFAIGTPLGLRSSVTQGIVSSINRSVSEGNGVTRRNVIQTKAEINPGS